MDFKLNFRKNFKVFWKKISNEVTVSAFNKTLDIIKAKGFSLSLFSGNLWKYIMIQAIIEHFKHKQI